MGGVGLLNVGIDLGVDFVDVGGLVLGDEGGEVLEFGVGVLPKCLPPVTEIQVTFGLPRNEVGLGGALREDFGRGVGFLFVAEAYLLAHFIFSIRKRQRFFLVLMIIS